MALARVLIFSSMMISVIAVGVVRSYAIDLQPGDVKPLPAGTNFSQLSFRLSQFGGIYANGQKRADIDLEVARYQIRLGHFFKLSNVTGVAYVQTGAANIDADNVAGDSGLEDTTVLLALWPYADHASQTYVGLGVYGLFPTGSYSGDRGVFNVGENRYGAALQAAFQTNVSQTLTLMSALDGIWFGSNHDFTAAQLVLDQDALYTAQVGLTYQPTNTFSISASYFYTWGGETSLDHAYRLSSGGFVGIMSVDKELAHDARTRRSLA